MDFNELWTAPRLVSVLALPKVSLTVLLTALVKVPPSGPLELWTALVKVPPSDPSDLVLAPLTSLRMACRKAVRKVAALALIIQCM